MALIYEFEILRRLRDAPPLLSPLPEVVAKLLKPCSCGGTFDGSAPARCPACRQPLSAKVAARWLEQPNHGWQWQRSWSGLYGLILEDRFVENPFNDAVAG